MTMLGHDTRSTSSVRSANRHWTAVLAAIASLAGAVHSTTAQSQVLEEITVTAQRRQQNEQDVGISIAAFNAEQLAAPGLQQGTDLARLTPGVHVAGSLAGLNSIFVIRGVTNNDDNDATEAPVAVYVDEGYAALGQGQMFAAFDLDRAEVLKGPQGTLFGRNATGGLVSFFTRKPTFEPEGYAKYTVGSFSQSKVEAAFGGPVSDRLAVRVAFMNNKNDGYLDNRYPFLTAPLAGPAPSPPYPGGADPGADDSTGIRTSLLFKATDRLTLWGSFNWSQTLDSTPPYQNKPVLGEYLTPASGQLYNSINLPLGDLQSAVNLSNGSAHPVNTLSALGTVTSRPVSGGDVFGYVDPDGAGPVTSCALCYPDGAYLRTSGVNAHADYDISDSLTLNSVTDYKRYIKAAQINVEAGPANLAGAGAANDSWNASQEIRLTGSDGPMRWVTGVYFLHIDADSATSLRIPEPDNGSFDLVSPESLRTTSYAGFGQLEFAFAPTVSLTTGGRVIREQKDFWFTQQMRAVTDLSNPAINGAILATNLPGTDNFGNNLGPRTLTASDSQNLWAGKVQLDWRPQDALLLYAGVNRGVKAGGWTAQGPGAGQVPLSDLEYAPETLYNYEAGFKSTLLGGAMRLDGSVFYYDYRNYQAFLFTGTSGVVVNKDALNRGVDLSVEWAPITGLNTSLSAAAMNPIVKDVEIGIGTGIYRDTVPVYSPKLQGDANISYTRPGLGGNITAAVNENYSSRFYYNLRNFQADEFSAYVLTNARLAWKGGGSNSDRYEVTFFVNNVTNAKAGLMGFSLADVCGCNEVSYQKPRWMGVTTEVKF
jgi:iron complex outermembrane receptor protein